MTTKSKIVKCVFTKSWTAPSGTVLYYHELTMEDGNVGTVGKTTPNPPDVAAGIEIEYTLESDGRGGNKIKVGAAGPATAPSTNGGTQPPVRPPYTKSGPKQVQISDYYGYIAGYTKDLVIAGKTTKKDIDAFKKVMSEIVEHFEGLISKSNGNTNV
jgi:hypothetical protein